MKRREAIGLLIAVCSGIARDAAAQATAGRRRVAVVAVGALDQQPLASLVGGLRALGHVDGKTVEYLPPVFAQQFGQLENAAAAAVRWRPDVIVSFGTTATQAVLKATDEIPVVFVVGTDPVEFGFTSSLAWPAMNATGFATATQVLVGKRLELLREVAPNMRSVAVIWNPVSAGQKASLRYVEQAAARLGIQVRPVEVRGTMNVDAISRSIADAGVNALIAVPSTSFLHQAARIVAVAATLRLPAVYTHADFVDAGGLLSYSPDLREQFRRAAGYVDRILKGARPAALPVEQPLKYELVVNLRTARAQGITIPQSVLLRADRVIE